MPAETLCVCKGVVRLSKRKSDPCKREAFIEQSRKIGLFSARGIALPRDAEELRALARLLKRARALWIGEPAAG